VYEKLRCPCQMGWFVVARFLLTSMSRCPSAIAELLVCLVAQSHDEWRWWWWWNVMLPRHMYYICNYFALTRDAMYCDERVCLSVCLSVRVHISRTSPNFLHMTLVAMARFSSVDAVIRQTYFRFSGRRHVLYWALWRRDAI